MPLPPPGARAFALAILNDGLDETSLIPFLDGLLRSGYQGVCPHPRDGLTVPYASRAFWRQFERLVELCKERGLEVWFYDEFPYPSGTAGGMLPAGNPAARARKLQFSDVSLTPNRDGLIDLGPDHLLVLLRYSVGENEGWTDIEDVTGDTGAHYDQWVWGEWHNRFYCGINRVRDELHERASAERYTIAYLADPPLRENERLLAVHVVEAPGKGNIARADVMAPEVTDEFLDRIYARFAEVALRQELTDVPVFQDEVSPGSTWPWNRIVEKRLREEWGAQWPLKMAGLRQPGVPGWELARHEYLEAITEILEENWFKRVAKYCAEHGLVMTGHLPGEESMLLHRQLMGDAFRMLRHFPIPGFDIISSHISDDVNRGVAVGPKLVQSAAWLDGRKPTMVEVFGANGMHVDLQKNRSTLGWLAAHDLTHTFDHSTYQSARGLRKYDAPPLSNRFNPLDTGRPDLWNWFNWLCDVLAQYKFDPDTLILFPIDSLSRYHPEEAERWAEQTNLLETWFYYATVNLDCVFVPPHRLGEVIAEGDGFTLEGQHFKHFWVPPLHSMHQDTWAELQRFNEAPGFTWSLPSSADGITVFGPYAHEGRVVPLTAPHVLHCDEDGLIATGVAWFEADAGGRLREVRAQPSVLKSLRRDPETGASLLLLLNPNETPVDVEVPATLGLGLLWPGGEPAASWNEESGKCRITLAPRDVRLFQWDEPVNSLASSSPAEPDFVNALQMEFRWLDFNYLKLSSGKATLTGQPEVPFQPAPISAIWELAGVHAMETAPYAPRHSGVNLAEALAFEVSFPIDLKDAVPELGVLIDADSLPPAAVVSWDGTPLEPITAAIFDAENTIFPIPADALAAGTHTLTVRGRVGNGMDGLHERPILVGDFSVLSEDRVQAPELGSRVEGWQVLNNVVPWAQLGAPQAFGPAQYRVLFTLEPGQACAGWELDMGSFIGTAEVAVNGTYAGRSNWEPRRVALPTLVEGENEVRVTLYGSWNNVLSDLNELENGLTSAPRLRMI